MTESPWAGGSRPSKHDVTEEDLYQQAKILANEFTALATKRLNHLSELERNAVIFTALDGLVVAYACSTACNDYDAANRILSRHTLNVAQFLSELK